MRIGINAIFLVPGQGGGIERYLRNLIRAFHEIGKAMGEDFSLKGKSGGPGDPVPGMKYDMPDFDRK